MLTAKEARHRLRSLDLLVEDQKHVFDAPGAHALEHRLRRADACARVSPPPKGFGAEIEEAKGGVFREQVRELDAAAAKRKTPFAHKTKAARLQGIGRAAKAGSEAANVLRQELDQPNARRSGRWRRSR